MSTNKTQNYALHAWVPEDDFLLSEINENFAVIDAALAGTVTAGTYTGDGTQGRFIDLGFTPKAALILPQDQHTSGSYYYRGGLTVAGSPLLNDSSSSARIVEGGFQVSHFFFSGGNYSTTVTCNNNGGVYHYIALQ